MPKDCRIDHILQEITAAGREIEPNVPDLKVDAETERVIALGLKVFDRLLPMLVRHVIAEYDKQKSA